MKTDLYTKTVLTIIALSLSIIAFRNLSFFPEAKAAEVPKNTVTLPLNPDGSINVRMSDVMDVNVSKVNGQSFYGSFPVNVKELSGIAINASNGIPVDIEAVDGLNITDAVPVKSR
jgi:hypothetical protein